MAIRRASEDDASRAGGGAGENRGTLIHTVGHSTRGSEEFVGLLESYTIEVVADVRTVPKSAHVPQFNREALAASLDAHGIGYAHMPRLGGLRHPRKDSVNTAWKNLSFRGYADYMQTPEFEQGLTELIELARRRRAAIMCAEAVPWRCHRSLVGDALLIRGFKVAHILSETSARPHELTPWARVKGLEITYPG